MSGQTQEFTICAPGAAWSDKKLFLGKFPGFPGKIPNLAGAKDVQIGTRRLDGGGEEVVLEGGPFPDRFRGTPDGALTGTAPSNYFVLIKQSGNFVAIPVERWLSFKPVRRHVGVSQSLEDAEAQMKYRRLQGERVNPRLAQAVETPLDRGGVALPGEEVDSDEEWKDIKARAASRSQGFGASQSAQAQPRERGASGAMADKMEDDEYQNRLPAEMSIYVPRPRDAEDWEHETEAADDDLEMGSGSDGEVEASPARGPAVMSDSDDNMDPAKVKKTIKRMMKETGLEDSSSSEGIEDDEEDDEEDEDDDDVNDEEDLDRLATKVLPGAAAPSPALTSAVGSAADRKRKLPTMVTEPSVEKKIFSLPQDQTHVDVDVGNKNKKLRQAGAAINVEIDAGDGVPKAAEIVALMQKRGKILLKELIAEFGPRVATTEAKRKFAELVKQVARLEPADAQGRKYLVLR